MPTPKAALPPPDTGPGSDEDFIFESSAGTIVIPSLATCKRPKPYRLAEVSSEKNYDALLVLFVRAALGTKAPRVEKILRELDQDEFDKFFQGWRDHSGIDPGE